VSASGKGSDLSWDVGGALAAGRLWGILRERVSRCTKRRYGGTLTVAAGSIQVPVLYLLSGSADADDGCCAFLHRRSRSKIAFLFGVLGLVALSLLAFLWSLGWWRYAFVYVSPLVSYILFLFHPLSQYSSRRLPLVMRVCINLYSSPLSPLKVLAVLRRGY
jgi:hypothetical protein